MLPIAQRTVSIEAHPAPTERNKKVRYLIEYVSVIRKRFENRDLPNIWSVWSVETAPPEPVVAERATGAGIFRLFVP